MDVLMKAVAAGTAAGLVALLIRRSNPELSLAVALSASALILFLALKIISSVTEVIDEAASLSGLSPAILSPVMKCVGLGVVTKLGAELCRDAGQGSVAASVELMGAACALYTALPLLQSVLSMIGGWL